MDYTYTDILTQCQYHYYYYYWYCYYYYCYHYYWINIIYTIRCDYINWQFQSSSNQNAINYFDVNGVFSFLSKLFMYSITFDSFYDKLLRCQYRIMCVEFSFTSQIANNMLLYFNGIVIVRHLFCFPISFAAMNCHRTCLDFRSTKIASYFSRYALCHLDSSYDLLFADNLSFRTFFAQVTSFFFILISFLFRWDIDCCRIHVSPIQIQKIGVEKIIGGFWILLLRMW